MALPGDTNARAYYRVAKQRLEDAGVLFREGKFNSAIYLAGYAIECMWKALIIERTARNQRAAIAATFRGARGHNFEWLRGQYRQTGASPFSPDFERSMSFVSTWEIELRYKPGIGNRSEAQRFLRETESVVTGIDGRI